MNFLFWCALVGAMLCSDQDKVNFLVEEYSIQNVSFEDFPFSEGEWFRFQIYVQQGFTYDVEHSYDLKNWNVGLLPSLTISGHSGNYYVWVNPRVLNPKRTNFFRIKIKTKD